MSNPSLSEFRARYPQFAGIADPTVQIFLDEAILEVSESVWDTFFKKGVLTLTAHTLVLNGHTGTGVASVAGGRIISRNVGDVSVSFSSITSGITGDDWYNLTVFGQEHLRLLRIVGPGLVVVSGAP